MAAPRLHSGILRRERFKRRISEENHPKRNSTIPSGIYRVKNLVTESIEALRG
jgi:hypothetical protein